MPAIQVELSLAAAASNNNIFSGSAFEYSRGRSALSCGITASATGIAFSLTSGADVIVEESTPFVSTLFPVVPDHMYYNDIMEPMDRLRLNVRNPTAGAIGIRSIALITPL